ELATVLAQLRRDVRVTEEGVELLLAPGLEGFPGLDGLDAVLGDRQAAPDRVLAQRDVVVLRAREVLQQVAERLRRDDAQVEAEPVVRDDGRLRVAATG